MNAITVKNLSKNYGKTTAVDHISFSVKEGAFFAFLGENGAGKSTTINILCTIFEKTEGEVEVFSHKLGEEDDKIREKIGIVFQNSVLDGVLTVKENLLTRASYYGIHKEEILERLHPLMQAFELESIWNRKYDQEDSEEEWILSERFYIIRRFSFWMSPQPGWTPCPENWCGSISIIFGKKNK